MAKHVISIGSDDLTEDQKIIYNSKIILGDNFLIEGGPGSGKTTLLFLFAQKINKLGYKFKIITSQNNLKNFLRDSFGKLDQYVFNAWGTSDLENYPEKEGLIFTQIIPYLNIIDFPSAGTFFQKDELYKEEKLNEVLDKAIEVTRNKKFNDNILLIDEAQDLPPIFFKIAKLFYNTIYVFGDKNQQIHDTGSSFSELIQILNIKMSNRFYLNINFRNSVQIYNFAKLTGFYDDDLEIINKGPRVEIISGDYNLVYEIENIMIDNIGTNIAIITNPQDQKVYQKIKNLQIVQNNEYINFLDYDNFCLNWKNNKGLEFDIVILSGFSKEKFFSKDMYVSITRTGYNKKNNTGWKLYVLDTEIISYLNLEDDENYNIIETQKEKEISLDDLPF